MSESDPDLRLLPLLLGIWAAMGVVMLSRSSETAALASVGAAALVASLLLLGRRSHGWPRAGSTDPNRPARPGVVGRLLVGVAGLGLGTCIASLHIAAIHPQLLEEVAQARHVVSADLEITGDPLPIRGAPADGSTGHARFWVGVRLLGLRDHGDEFRSRAPAVLTGPSVGELSHGQRVRLSARAGPPWAWHSQSMELTQLGSPQVVSPAGGVAAATNAIRGAFRSACAGLPPDAGALLLGLAVGDRSTLPPELDADMTTSGLAHLTAVSGANTSLVAGMTIGLAAALGLRWRARVAVCLTVLLAYVALVRPEPSVLRAAGMGVVALLALSTGGRRAGPPALLATAGVLLLLRPQLALSLGFALSFAATAGLLLAGPLIADRLGAWPVTSAVPEPIRAALAVATAAHLATLPLTVLMGNGISLAALPANVLVAPLVPPATILGLVAALLAVWLPGVAAAIAHLGSLSTAPIAWVAHQASDVPFTLVRTTAGPLPALATALTILILAVGLKLRQRPWARRAVAGAAICALLGWLLMPVLGYWRRPPPGWMVLACDVGQGDGLLLRQPGSAEALLVDVGPDPQAIAGCLRRAGVRRVVVLITHAHADHLAGLPAVLADWPVSMVLTTSVAEPPDAAAALAVRAEEAAVPLRLLSSGDRLVAAGVELRILWPAWSISESRANNGSVVARADIPTSPGSRPLRVLLTGDIEPAAQAEVMRTAAGAIDVVKVPHHGSGHQDPGFAGWARAGIALISVGTDNDYGHPDAGTVAAYARLGTVGRTDLGGYLAVVAIAGGPVLVSER